VLKGEATMCKHVLAAHIAAGLGMHIERAVSNMDFQAMLCHADMGN
jgi:hypothetical protein